MKNKKIIVIKAGGELLEKAQKRNRIQKDLIRLSKKNWVIFVHGGGPQIQKDLVAAKIIFRFKNGRRVTTPQSMTVVEKALSGNINKAFSAELSLKGVSALGLSCRDAGILTARPLPGLGRAGRPHKVNPKPILSLLKAGFLPVLSTVASDKKGQALNVNADDAAGALAVALKADRLAFLTNVPGVLDQNKKRIPTIKIKDLPRLIQTGVITGGMIPKTQNAATCVKKGVGEVDILPGHKGLRLNDGTRILK